MNTSAKDVVPAKFDLNLTVQAQHVLTVGNPDTKKAHEDFNSQKDIVNQHWESMSKQIQESIKHIGKMDSHGKHSPSQPNLQALALIEAQEHLFNLSDVLHNSEKNPDAIIPKLQGKATDLKGAMDETLSGAQEMIKKHSESSDPVGREIRDTIQKMSPDKITKLIESKTPNLTQPEVWASLAQNKAASLYLTPHQQKIAQGNVLKAMPMDYEKLSDGHTEINNEIRNINNQMNVAQNYISNNLNSLKQMYPAALKGLNAK